MKKLFFLAAIAAMFTLLPSCDEKMDIPEAGAQKVLLDVSVSAPGAMTKATGSVNTNATNNDTEGEAKVNSLQVFVFAGDVRDGYSTVSNASSTTVACTAGARDIICLINAPALNTVTSKAALLATVSNLGNSASNFEMMGMKSQTVADGGTVSVEVNRIASKIVLKKITNSLRAGGAMTIKRVYITNVAGQINYGGDAYSPADGKWYNKGGYQASNNLGAFTQDINLTQDVAASGEYTTNHYFYAYPNNYAQANYAATWVPKRTMLVIQIQYNGTLYDYPIDLGVALESNKMYVLNNVTLQNLGNVDDGNEGGEDEENPVSGITATVNIDVQDWSVVLVNSDGNITI